jgi:DNA binding domain, excisionase family
MNSEINELPDLLTLEQVSELLQVHSSTLRNWDRDGTLKAVRIGIRKLYRYAIRKKALLNFLKRATRSN